NLAETRKRRRLYVLLTLVFILAGLVGTIVGFLKLLHGMGIAQGPIAKLFHAIWWVPGIPWLWEHASLISPGMPGNWSLYSYVCIGLVFIGVVFRLLAGSKHYDITQSNREARVERLNSIFKFFQVDIPGIVRKTSYPRYCKEGVGSRRPNWR